jgi:GTPase SAR1 family protein
MGCCSSSATGNSAETRTEKNRNKQIEQVNEADFRKENQVQKLLLLGAGESGKSTLFKQIVDLYGKGFSEEEYMEYVPIVFSNTIHAIQVLCRQSEALGEEKSQVLPENQNAKQFILDLPSGAMLDDNIVEVIKKLWKDPGILYTYSLRSKYQLPVAAEYFFSHMDTFIQPNWRPNKQDILQCRVRTTGIMETSISFDGFQMKIVDVGGQRNERKKWIHSFENVSAVLFVAAISEYDQTLFEDESVNRIQEALTIFRDICNSRWFAESSMILFLNKSDLFREKLKKVPLNVCFPDYQGKDEFEEAWQYIADQFLNLRTDKSKDVYVHVTCATNDDNVQFVFNSVRDIVIQKALKKSGLMA